MWHNTFLSLSEFNFIMISGGGLSDTQPGIKTTELIQLNKNAEGVNCETPDPMVKSRMYFGMTKINGSIVACGGTDPICEKYNLETKTWSASAASFQGGFRRYTTAVPLDENRIWIGRM